MDEMVGFDLSHKFTTVKQNNTAMAALISTALHGALPLIAKGKVRDIYELPDNSSLLFVATDRISAYDAVMKNVLPPPPRNFPRY